MNKDELQKALRGHPLMAPLREDQLESMAQAGEAELYDPGEVIVTEGSLGDAVYMILDGKTGVAKKESGGRMLAELESGEFFGEMSLVEATTRSATVAALEKTTVFRLPNAELQRLAEADPQCMNRIMVVIIRTLSSRLRRMNSTLAAVAQLSDYLAGTMV